MSPILEHWGIKLLPLIEVVFKANGWEGTINWSDKIGEISYTNTIGI